MCMNCNMFQKDYQKATLFCWNTQHILAWIACKDELNHRLQRFLMSNWKLPAFCYSKFQLVTYNHLLMYQFTGNWYMFTYVKQLNLYKAMLEIWYVFLALFAMTGEKSSKVGSSFQISQEEKSKICNLESYHISSIAF